MTRLKRFGRETFSSFEHRNFRLFFSGQFISMTGNWLTLIAQSLLILQLTDNNGIAVGLLTACQFLPVLLIGAWAGLVADRSDKRRLLVIVQVFAMLQSFVLAALAFMGNPPIWTIYAVAFAGGIATAFDNPARRAFVAEMVPGDKVQNAVSLNSALMTSARIFGPALAGLLIVTVGFGWCFLLDGLTYTAVIVGYMMMRPAELHPTVAQRRAKGQIRAGLRYTRSQRELWIPLVMMALIGTFAFNFAVTLPLFTKKTLGGTITTFTLMYAVVSIGSLVGALATARRARTKLDNVITAGAFFGVSMLGFALAPGVGFAFALALFLGLCGTQFMTTSTAIVQLRANPEMRGRVLALQSIVFLGTAPIGGPIVGAICQQFGARAGLAFGAAACLGAAAWGVLAARRWSAADLGTTEPVLSTAG